MRYVYYNFKIKTSGLAFFIICSWVHATQLANMAQTESVVRRAQFYLYHGFRTNVLVWICDTFDHTTLRFYTHREVIV